MTAGTAGQEGGVGVHDPEQPSDFSSFQPCVEAGLTGRSSLQESPRPALWLEDVGPRYPV